MFFVISTLTRGRWGGCCCRDGKAPVTGNPKGSGHWKSQFLSFFCGLNLTGAASPEEARAERGSQFGVPIPQGQESPGVLSQPLGQGRGSGAGLHLPKPPLHLWGSSHKNDRNQDFQCLELNCPGIVRTAFPPVTASSGWEQGGS